MPESNINFTLPSTLAAGTYYVGVIADYNNAVSESNESNNSSTGVAITITSSQPDLTASDVKIYDTALAAGDSTTVTFDIHNTGTGDVLSAFYGGVYLSTNRSISTSDTLLASQYFSSNSGNAVLPGLGWNFNDVGVTVTMPIWVVPGTTYYIGAVADYSGNVTESNESNNSSTGVAITIPAISTITPLHNLDVLFDANISQAKGISAIYQILLGGVPNQAGFTFLINGNNLNNFGAGPGPVFNDENIYINIANALVQGNAAATTAFNSLASSASLVNQVTSLYMEIIPVARQSTDGLAYLTSTANLAFYTSVAAERGITSDNGPAIIAFASLLKIAVDGNIGVGNAVNDLLAAVNNGDL